MISKKNWSHYQNPHFDQIKHERKIKKAIQENLSDMIGEESILISGEKSIKKIPIKYIRQPKIQYAFDSKNQIGMGNGNAKVGDSFSINENNLVGSGSGASDKSGIDWYEIEMNFEEIEESLFDELELPLIEKKELVNQILTESFDFKDVRSHGLQNNIDKKRTLLRNLKRNAMKGNPVFGQITKEDIVYKSWVENVKELGNAVIFALMDISGSMGVFEKSVARNFYFLVKRFLETKYKQVEIIYIGHHSEAKVLTEDQFFLKGEAGGTICSSAYRLMNEIIQEKYPPESYNIFGFHVSDGDNLSTDNPACKRLIEKLCKDIVMFGYVEINPNQRPSTLNNVYKELKSLDNLQQVQIVEKNQDIYQALKLFFSKNKQRGSSK
ncbi:YeaH/YhbH family protein [Bacillus methanolicus]|uniref:UPF0229-like protein n=1 Tax=Bacillus methanolicus (strain MGA3 / ATCC 53907) TaxID=796606 RepID=I3E8Z7_BACMM|nr:DUF444 family protein [Bacillus methanolicus]AIE60230.1 UPF0229-like protein [Bacillus methanolicus MGA3]EIJ82968.1 hypothetical protein MGA3_07080 [Bacillus methanolicus MGA3]